MVIVIVAFLLAAAVVLDRAYRRELAHADELVAQLAQAPLAEDAEPVAFESVEELPEPVRAYFQKSLTPGQMRICRATLQQAGELRVDTGSDDWMRFSATEIVVPGRGFAWNAQIALPFRAHLQVLDSFIAGIGSGRVNVLGTIPVVQDRDNPQLNSGALHRYLAETVWFPTALLPQAGVRWTPIDETRALASLIMDGVTVSLEFRFNERNEIESVYSPARWGTFDGGYQQRPWEGRFRDYREIQGMRIPQQGEVGWYTDDKLEFVWRGKIEDASFTLCQ